MSGLVAQDYGLQGLLMAVEDESSFQGAPLVMPICREGLLQDEALRDGQRQGVPGVERGERAKAIKAAGRARAQLGPGSSDWACHKLAGLRLCHREEHIRTHISPASRQSTPVHHRAMPSRHPSDLGRAGVLIAPWQQRPKDRQHLGSVALGSRGCG